MRVGMEASGHARWFERLLRDLQFELWIGDAAEIRTKRVRKQKTDRQDAQLLLRLMVEDRFPRIWVADAENRDLRQLLWHRHRLVQMRTRVMNHDSLYEETRTETAPPAFSRGITVETCRLICYSVVPELSCPHEFGAMDRMAFSIGRTPLLSSSRLFFRSATGRSELRTLLWTYCLWKTRVL